MYYFVQGGFNPTPPSTGDSKTRRVVTDHFGTHNKRETPMCWIFRIEQVQSESGLRNTFFLGRGLSSLGFS